MTQQSQQFCQQCHSTLQAILGLGQLGPSGLHRAGYEAANLRLLAQSDRRMILERYARDLQQLCRDLQTSTGPWHGLERGFSEAVNFGLQCGGNRREACVEMRFDQLLDLEARLHLV